MEDDLTRDVGSPLAGEDDDLPPSLEEDDLDDNFDRELREAERELEEADSPPLKTPKHKTMDEDDK